MCRLYRLFRLRMELVLLMCLAKFFYLLYWAEVLVIYYVWADAHMCINVEAVFFRQYNAIGDQKDEFDHFACEENYLEYT